jgi:hypothetical protein
VEEVGAGRDDQIAIHRFSIQGDSLWIVQCFTLITQVARNRLSYPPDLLFANEDEPTCLSDRPAKPIISSLLSLPILNVNKYFSFTRPRKHEILVAPPPVQNLPS